MNVVGKVFVPLRCLMQVCLFLRFLGFFQVMRSA